jgi:hypothetical protein
LNATPLSSCLTAGRRACRQRWLRAVFSSGNIIDNVRHRLSHMLFREWQCIDGFFVGTGGYTCVSMRRKWWLCVFVFVCVFVCVCVGGRVRLSLTHTYTTRSSVQASRAKLEVQSTLGIQCTRLGIQCTGTGTSRKRRALVWMDSESPMEAPSLA